MCSNARATCARAPAGRGLPALFVLAVSIPPGSVRFDSIRFDSIRFDSIRFDSIRFDSIRFDSVRFDPRSPITSLCCGSLRRTSPRSASLRFAFAPPCLVRFRFALRRFLLSRFVSPGLASIRFAPIPRAQVSLCSPSRSSFLTGLRPDSTMVWNLLDDIRTTNEEDLRTPPVWPVVTLPEYVRHFFFLHLAATSTTLANDQGQRLQG